MNSSIVEKNLKQYPKFYILFHSYAWASVFFLYFLEKLPIEKVLLLESIYYISAVLFEVPSGYFSDRVGRKLTLLIASSTQVIAYFLFAVGSTFFVFALAQILFAVAYTFASGTDQSFYFENFIRSKSKKDYGSLEASLLKKAMLFRALAQLVVGIICIYSLRFGYGLSFIIALIAMFYAFSFTDIKSEIRTKDTFCTQLINCFKYWKNPTLLWVTIFTFIFTICTHFPYEFFQAYIDLLDPKQLKLQLASYSMTTVFTGVVASGAIFIAAFVAGSSIKVRNVLGFKPTLVLALVVNAVILFGMGHFLNYWVLVLLLMRSIPAAISRAPLAAEVSPLIENKLRATFMSVNSLIGRLGYGLVLIWLSTQIEGGANNWENLSSLIIVGLYIALVGIVALTIYGYLRVSSSNK